MKDGKHEKEKEKIGEEQERAIKDMREERE